ncbi:transmembrane protease serine 9-like [Diorhabda sublineata]|uniref:transmembrane protease serine 9-like n=1 Tax=Diorhabda sublineata TaxID=1163346 RepID=UPI0024E06974|nr:transmembrane protease serine 9-like [Diorhabda sublineata]
MDVTSVTLYFTIRSLIILNMNVIGNAVFILWFMCGNKLEASKNNLTGVFVFPKDVKTKSVSRIMGGENVSPPHSYPYQAALLAITSRKETFCGGTLIDRNWILTAAHCVNDNFLYAHILLGSHDITNTQEKGRQVYYSDKVYVHDDLDLVTFQNDIALVKLSQSARLNNYVNLVKISSDSDTYVGKTATILGWGATEFTSISNILKKVEVTVLSNDDCKFTNNVYNSVIQNTHLCTSGVGTKGICDGDSGGPLIIDNIQIGVASFGASDCAGTPSVFTRVSKFNDWITYTILNKSNKVFINFIPCYISTSFSINLYQNDFVNTFTLYQGRPIEHTVILLDVSGSDLSDIFVFPKDVKTKSVSRIMGGENVSPPHSYPYQAAIYTTTSKQQSFCGGTLIEKNWILTAAHCVNDNFLYATIFLGSHDISNTQEEGRQVYYSDKVYVNDGFDPATLQNDIALIKLSQSATLDNYVNLVNISSDLDTYNGISATILGWGTTETTSVSNILKKVEVIVLSNDECKSTNDAYNLVIQDTHLCTSGMGIKGSCTGDSGGPLIIDDIQIGVVSFGPIDCATGYPSVFTRVSEFNDWITYTILNKSNKVFINIIPFYISTLFSISVNFLKYIW